VKNPAVELPSEPSDDAQFKLRSYQQEMVDESMQRNIIVAVKIFSLKNQRLTKLPCRWTRVVAKRKCIYEFDHINFSLHNLTVD